MKKNIPDETIDLVVTSPPYDNLRDYEGYIYDFENTAIQLTRILKPGGVIVWVIGDQTINGSESLTSFKNAIYFVENCGLKLHDTMIYEKINYMPLNDNRYENAFEYMFIFSKNHVKNFNPIKINKKTNISKVKKWHRCSDGNFIINKTGNKTQKVISNIWPYIIGNSISEEKNYEHPAIFPEKLAEDHIVSWSNETDIILDPFAGSGTTLKAAKKLNRKYIGFEISEKYCKIIDQRLKQDYLFNE